MADQAKALMLAEAATQDDGSAIPVEEGDTGDNIAGPLLGHVFKKAQVEAGEGGSRVAAAVQRDEHEKAITEDRAKFERNDPMDVHETKQSSWSEAEKSSAAGVVHKRLLERMEWLCRTAGYGQQNGRETRSKEK